MTLDPHPRAPDAGQRSVCELSLTVPEEHSDVLSAWLFELGAQGIEERSGADGVTLLVYGEEQGALEQLAQELRDKLAEAHTALGEEFPLELVALPVQVLTKQGVDWETEWLRHLGPVLVGDTLVLQPVWDDSPAPGQRRKVLFEPRMAFGDGSHPTTLLAAESVERFCLAKPGARVLDVGTGSGVLGLVALLCGAARVVANDIDVRAVEAARVNAALNGLTAQFEVSLQPLGELPKDNDLVVANIDEPTLRALGRDLVAALAPAGRLVLTGVLAGATEELEAELRGLGLSRTLEEQHRDWALLEFERGTD
jgi:ribosomal protein L11 methyltransferase